MSKPEVQSPDTEVEKEELLWIRKQLSRVHHDMNNPLSIISGNVQLLVELSRALHVDKDLASPLRDMDAAIEKLTESIDRLILIRHHIDRLNQG